MYSQGAHGDYMFHGPLAWRTSSGSLWDAPHGSGFLSTLKRFDGVIRDDAQIWEARNLSRQRGYAHMGLLITAKKFGFVQGPSLLCPAAKRMAEFVVLGVEEQKLALCKEPTAFRTFYQQLEAAEKDFPALVSPMDLPAHMAVFNDKLAMALEKAVGLNS